MHSPITGSISQYAMIREKGNPKKNPPMVLVKIKREKRGRSSGTGIPEETAIQGMKAMLIQGTSRGTNGCLSLSAHQGLVGSTVFR